MRDAELMGKIENILFAAGDSMGIGELAAFLGKDEAELTALLEEEIVRREREDSGLVIKRFEDRVQLATREEYAEMLFSLFGESSEEELTRDVYKRQLLFESAGFGPPSGGGSSSSI